MEGFSLTTSSIDNPEDGRCRLVTLVRLDLGIGGGLVLGGDGDVAVEEVFGVVSGCKITLIDALMCPKT